MTTIVLMHWHLTIISLFESDFCYVMNATLHLLNETILYDDLLIKETHGFNLVNKLSDMWHSHGFVR